MNAIENAIKFLEEIVIECEPNTGCGRCDDARKVVEDLRGLSNSNNKPLVKADVSGRSELLLAYHEFYLSWRKTVTDSSAKYCVEAFLSKQ